MRKYRYFDLKIKLFHLSSSFDISNNNSLSLEPFLTCFFSNLSVLLLVNKKKNQLSRDLFLSQKLYQTDNQQISKFSSYKRSVLKNLKLHGTWKRNQTQNER